MHVGCVCGASAGQSESAFVHVLMTQQLCTHRSPKPEPRAPVQVCAEERKVFCSDVSTGKARVFRCLVHNLGKADFGDTCKKEVMEKLRRRQQNWKLDVTLRTACKGDVAEVCSEVDHDLDHAEVTRCLISNHWNLTDGCRHEVCCGYLSCLGILQNLCELREQR